MGKYLGHGTYLMLPTRPSRITPSRNGYPRLPDRPSLPPSPSPKGGEGDGESGVGSSAKPQESASLMASNISKTVTPSPLAMTSIALSVGLA